MGRRRSSRRGRRGLGVLLCNIRQRRLTQIGGKIIFEKGSIFSITLRDRYDCKNCYLGRKSLSAYGIWLVHICPYLIPERRRRARQNRRPGRPGVGADRATLLVRVTSSGRRRRRCRSTRQELPFLRRRRRRYLRRRRLWQSCPPWQTLAAAASVATDSCSLRPPC